MPCLLLCDELPLLPSLLLLLLLLLLLPLLLTLLLSRHELLTCPALRTALSDQRDLTLLVTPTDCCRA